MGQIKRVATFFPPVAPLRDESSSAATRKGAWLFRQDGDYGSRRSRLERTASSKIDAGHGRHGVLFGRDRHQDVVHAAFPTMPGSKCGKFESGRGTVDQCVHDWQVRSFQPLADYAIILHTSQRKGANHGEVFHASQKTFCEAVPEFACLPYQTFLGIIGKTNGGLRETRRIAEVNGVGASLVEGRRCLSFGILRGYLFTRDHRRARCGQTAQEFSATELAHSSLLTPSLLDLLKRAPFRFRNEPPHVEEAHEGESPVDGKRPGKI